MRLLIAITMLCSAAMVAVEGMAAPPDADIDQTGALESYAALIEELSHRRRVNVLFPNPQSIFDGYHLGFVNVGTGNLTFRRRDMVTRTSAANVEFARVYDSRIEDNRDFGPGWRLSLAEELLVHDDTLTYIDRSGARHRFALSTDGVYRVDPPKPSHMRTQVTVSPTRVLIETEDGAVREFTRLGRTPKAHRYSIASLIRAPNGEELKFHYRDGLLSSITVGGNRVFAVDRNVRGRITSAVDNLGRTVKYSYTADYRLKDVLDVAGHLWWYEYDKNGLTNAVGPNRQPFLEVRYSSGKVSESYAGRRYVFEYPRDGRTDVVEGIGAEHTFRQTGSGVTYELQSTSGVGWRLTLDQNNHVRRLTTASGSHFFHYDSAHRLAKMSASNQEWTMTYGQDGLVATRSDEGLTTVSRIDDTTHVSAPWGKIEFVVDSRGVRYVESTYRTVAVERDGLGEISALRSGDSVVRFVRNAAGRITRVKYPNGFESIYAYDDLGNRVSAHYSAGVSPHYAYDPSGNIVRISTAGPNGQSGTQTYVIGKMNRVRSIVNADNGLSMNIDYDPAGNPIRFKTKDDTVAAKYDNGHLASLRSAKTGRVADMDALMRDVVDVDVAHERTFAKRTLFARSVPVPSQPSYGVVAFDESNAAKIGDPLVSDVPLYLDAMMVLDVAEAFFSLDGHIAVFEKPSNPVFHPPEYASINCCVPCFGVQCVCGALLPYASNSNPDEGAGCGCLLEALIEGLQGLLGSGGGASEDVDTDEDGEGEDDEKEPTCLPCVPPVGTLMYQFHAIHYRHRDSPGRNHNLPGRHHYHHYKVGQIPATNALYPCKCKEDELRRKTVDIYPGEIIFQTVSGGGLDDC